VTRAEAQILAEPNSTADHDRGIASRIKGPKMV